MLVDAEHDIVHLSPAAGRFLQFSGGEPSRNLLQAVDPSLRIELRAALYQAAQTKAFGAVRPVIPVDFDGETCVVTIRVVAGGRAWRPTTHGGRSRRGHWASGAGRATSRAQVAADPVADTWTASSSG